MPQPDPYLSLRASAGAWIASADSKATALIGVDASLFTLVAAVVAATGLLRDLGPYGITAFALFCTTSIISLSSACYCLWPRLERKEILAEANWTPIDRSPSHFFEVAQLSRDQLKTLLHDVDIQESDNQEQAFVAAVIASKKMSALKTAVVSSISSLAMLIFLLGALVFHSIPKP